MVTPLTAYGPRTRAQLLRVVAELTKAPDSRRAVVYVGRDAALQKAYTEAEERAGEMPCTCHWQFLLRDGALNMTVYMRSWDAVWGLTYDVPCFVAVQQAVAAALKVPVGRYVHHAGSLHVYERHWGWEAWDTEDELLLDWLQDDLHKTQEAAGRLLAARKEML
jgi:thymidylate synthase